MPTGGDREQLLAGLGAEFRRMSVQSVLLNQVIADRLGIAASDLNAVNALARGPMTAGRLAEETGLTTGAITGSIDRLVAAGFVRRAKDPTDRRRVIVEPLPERMAELAELFGRIRERVAQGVGGLTDDQLSMLLQLQRQTNQIVTEETRRLRAQPSRFRRT
ncbi:MarR family transcriptional regulator [Pseudonocardiaceae bacterium YIM PH 21723]|nr:MarR family transcriptional regulator [Pseudonocardiaceae bacterium YIM PH 21723]